jgi:mRNA interferase RelE/StbE
LGQLDNAVRKRLGTVIDRLARTPRPGQATQIVGDPKTWRIRVGDWRILYEIQEDEQRLVVLDVGHRSRIYDR